MPVRFSQVDNQLLRGGEPSDIDLKQLKDIWGVNKIVSLDGPIADSIHNKCEELGLQHVIFPLTDGDDPNIQNIPLLVSSLTRNGPTYIHCRHGKDRTGIVCAAYRVMKNGWHPMKARQEALQFGLGVGNDPGTAESFFAALDGVLGNEDVNNAGSALGFSSHIQYPGLDIYDDGDSLKDQNKLDHDVVLPSEDAVSRSRENMEAVFSQPGINRQTEPLFQQQDSWNTRLDVEKDHLNRSASSNEINIKQANQQIFKYCTANSIFSNDQLWAESMTHARTLCRYDEDVHMYAATIPSNARIEEFSQHATRILTHAAMLNGADIVVFNPVNAPIEYFVINPNVLKNIHRLGSKDENEVPNIGLHDNYTGLAPYFFPGSGGQMPAAFPETGGTLPFGGDSGPVQAPFTQYS